MTISRTRLDIKLAHLESQVLAFCFVGGGCMFGLFALLALNLDRAAAGQMIFLVGLPLILIVLGLCVFAVSKRQANRQLSDEHKAILADFVSESPHAQQYVQVNSVEQMTYRSFESAIPDIERLVIRDKVNKLSRFKNRMG